DVTPPSGNCPWLTAGEGGGGRGGTVGHRGFVACPHPGLPPQAGEGAGAWLRWLPPPLAGRAGVGAGGEGAGRAPSLRAAIPPAATPPAAPASAATGRTRPRGRAPPAAPRRGPASAARRPRPGTPSSCCPCLTAAGTPRATRAPAARRRTARPSRY